MTTDELLKVERKDRVNIITLNRSAARNALTAAMLHQLDAALRDCEENRETRVLIITGGVHFCAGGDLRELGQMTPAQAKEFSQLGQAVFRRIEALSKVVIAAVAGNALGGGCELALACDIRLAGEGARFGLPEVNLGLDPRLWRHATAVRPGGTRQGKGDDLQRQDHRRAGSGGHRPGKQRGRGPGTARSRHKNSLSCLPEKAPWPMPPSKSCYWKPRDLIRALPWKWRPFAIVSPRRTAEKA